MKLGIVIYSDHAETVWNGFRLANFALKKRDEVKVFLLANGVEAESLSNDKFNVKEQMEQFVADHGEILACGTCLKIRNSEGTELCPLSTMADLYDLIDQSDKVLSL
ncbi:MAG: DsrE family protein [Reichenbachiella sp.]|uniref:DsrE family protein n=1 Tax=Reichenbachiella sp. TaxID=2184521 RepID=UPI003265980E